MPKLWITYAWVDNTQGDFDYLAQELREAGIDAQFDRIALIPGRRLWDQIADRISAADLAGWAYLLTSASLSSEPCREELAYALDRALATRDRDFPLIGLLNGVRIQDVPPALRVRLCVSLADPNWRNAVLAGLEGRAPSSTSPVVSKHVWSIHENYGGNLGSTAVEIRPRFGEVMYWRIVIPKGTTVKSWGHGPAGGGALSCTATMVVRDGTGQIDGAEVCWFGAGDKLTSGISAYVVFPGSLPAFVSFGVAKETFGPPIEVESFPQVNPPKATAPFDTLGEVGGNKQVPWEPLHTLGSLGSFRLILDNPT